MSDLDQSRHHPGQRPGGIDLHGGRRPQQRLNSAPMLSRRRQSGAAIFGALTSVEGPIEREQPPMQERDSTGCTFAPARLRQSPQPEPGDPLGLEC